MGIHPLLGQLKVNFFLIRTPHLSAAFCFCYIKKGLFTTFPVWTKSKKAHFMSFLRRQVTTSHPNMPHNIHQYYVYILTNHKNGTLYIGMTNNLQRRVQEHKSEKLKGFTQRYGLHILVYYEFHQYVSNAILREKQLKKWKRSWKIRLIEGENPYWVDLAKGWF